MQHLQAGTTLQGGKYRIERVLGQGGFGNTFHVRKRKRLIVFGCRHFHLIGCGQQLQSGVLKGKANGTTIG